MALVIAIGCGDDVGRVECGMHDTSMPCCPTTWRAGDACDAKAEPPVCWSACDGKIKNSDGTTDLVRHQLVCSENPEPGSRAKSVILSGLGLFPCEPDTGDP